MSFSEFVDLPKIVVEAVDLSYEVSLKSDILDMTNMGIISQTIGNSYNKVEKMKMYCSDDTGTFTNI